MSRRRGDRRHAGYAAFVIHRLSGVLLALFLPLHFLALGLALEGARALDEFLMFAQLPWVKFSEWGLVVLLSVHLAFGLRILALEFLPWRGARKHWIGWGTGVALATGLLFVIGVS
jgi:succinate dehydrogenase subunit D